MSSPTTTYRLATPDMGCGHCVNTIESTLRQLPGVRNVRADLESKTVIVTVDRADVDEATVRSTLEEAGYPAS